LTRASAAILAAFCVGAAAEAFAAMAAPETTEVFAEPPEGGVLVLAHRFLLVGSEVVRVDGELRAREVDYRLDPDAGLLRWADGIQPPGGVSVSYSWVPVDLPREFTSLVRGEASPEGATALPEGTPSASREGGEQPSPGAGLRITGAKTLAMEVGSNKDAAVEQSLRVQVRGDVGDHVRVTALLSDQDIPLQPEGNTRRLEELDEVLIRVESRRGSATLGDFVAGRSGSAFGDFDRRLSGAEAVVKAGGVSVRGIGAGARGNFRKAEFRGMEGKQGPYVLAGDGENPEGVIVAGSEKVWLDGRALTRGENHDYVIDYSRGEVEFTNRVLVTEDSEIAVDFEVAEQEYRRSFYFGETKYSSEGRRVQVGASFAAETDGHDPLRVTLTDERRLEMQQAGDTTVVVPGWVCDLEDGDYHQIDGHFEYAGRDSGSCEVSFSRGGADSLRAYERDRDLDTGLTYFRWVGPGLGEYAPYVELAAPRSAALADVGVRLEAGEAFHLSMDAAVSREDANTLSSVDDGDNTGRAGNVTLSFDPGGADRAKDALRWHSTASHRTEEASFVSMGRTRGAFLGEVWNFTDTTRTDEAVTQVETRLERPGRWALGGAWGRMDRTGRFASERREGSASWKGGRIESATLRVESVRREDRTSSSGGAVGDLLRQRGEVIGRLGPFHPGVSWWKEWREDRESGARTRGEDDEELGASLDWKPGRGYSARARLGWRRTDVVDSALGEWVRQSIGRTAELRGEASPSRSFRARFSWIRRALDVVEGRPGEDRVTHLLRGDLSHENLGGLLRGDYAYEATSRVFTDRVAGSSATEEPTLAVSASARVRVGGRSRRSRGAAESADSALRRILSKVEAETVIRVQEETTAADRTSIYLLDLAKYQRDDTTVYGKILLRQEATLFPGAARFSVTGRLERIDAEDNRADPERVEIVTTRRVLRARNALNNRWTLETQGTWQTQSRSDRGAAEFDIRLLEIREELVWQPHPARRLSGVAAWVSERNEEGGSFIKGASVALEGSSSVGAGGRVSGRLSWTHPLEAGGADTGMRFRTRDENELEWRTTAEVRLSDSVSASLSYSGRSLEGIPTRHLARVQARALF
jgi:hypothetical protein